MAGNLAGILRRMRAESLIRQAETIRDYPPGDERTHAAESHVRETMLQRTLANITRQEEYQIFSILHFLMPSDAPFENDRPPPKNRPL
jgi:hypothetical protein